MRLPKTNKDKPRCACGIFGIFSNEKSSLLTYYGLHALQHRGQEGGGIVSCEFDQKRNRHHFNLVKGMGLITDVFKDYRIVEEQLKGNSAIGHNRYSTAGSANNRSNLQPFIVNYRDGNLALAHNGNLTNFRTLRQKLQKTGTIFQTTSDSELILHLVARSKKKKQIEQIIEALKEIDGAFSVVILTDNALVAARDRYGLRPLVLGLKDKSYVVASETCAFDLIDAKFVREIDPGEVIVIENNAENSYKPESYRITKKVKSSHHCIFEYIYFSRPDSFVFGESVDKVRRKLGKALAEEAPVVADPGEKYPIVISVPDSSNTATLGYVSESNKKGIPAKLEIGLIRNHYVGRTFIQPEQGEREMKVKTKYNTVKGVLKNRKVIVVDDSIVRGTTSKQLIKLIKEAEPKEIHFRITSPQIVNPCHWGMDFPSKEELIAHRCESNVELIRRELGVDSLHYLSMGKLLESVPKKEGKGYCTACFGGPYPTKIEKTTDKNELES
jgi:amidophosphoribosyltransferase